MSPQKSPYDFILSDAAKRPRLSQLPMPTSTAGRALLVAGGAALLIIIVVIFASLLSGGSSAKDQLRSVLRSQTEMVRITGQSILSNSDQATRYSVETINLSLLSDQTILTEALASRGLTFKNSDLASPSSDKTDASIEAAKNAGTLSSSTQALLREMLTSYQAELQAAFDATADKPVQELLSASFNHAKLLLEQLPE